MAKAKEAAPAEKKELTGPPSLVLELRTPTGEVWGQIVAPMKEFKTGSQGYYANGKIVDPQTGNRFQVGANVILIGSKG